MEKEISIKLTCLKKYFGEADSLGAQWIGRNSRYYNFLKLPQ